MATETTAEGGDVTATTENDLRDMTNRAMEEALAKLRRLLDAAAASASETGSPVVLDDHLQGELEYVVKQAVAIGVSLATEARAVSVAPTKLTGLPH
ncbi:hypothetical protein [Sulfurifustis variabilis]|uniref:hypothetical protein n=1 Tax=Sulfurifustis variabilis TaxID=1675686 RepID=UPI000BBB5873|nr:hypothetical protein [Sulfurifustis variabilis]